MNKENDRSDDHKIVELASTYEPPPIPKGEDVPLSPPPLPPPSVSALPEKDMPYSPPPAANRIDYIAPSSSPTSPSSYMGAAQPERFDDGSYGPSSNGDSISTLTILAFILSWVVPIAGVVLGAVSISQIAKSKNKGMGLAIAAVVIGAVLTLFQIIILFLTAGITEIDSEIISGYDY